METYSFLREFADSWFLIAMFAFFVGAGVWAFLPWQKSSQIDAASIPFRDDTTIDPTANTSDAPRKTDILKEAQDV